MSDLKTVCKRCKRETVLRGSEAARARVDFNAGRRVACMLRNLEKGVYFCLGETEPVVEPCLDTSHLSNAAYRAAAPMPDIPVE